ncbi:hypothetical protein SKAU_G00144700 [Synaphobranchus kaupii]|uniref:Uncharacterized protein n=1 Tax=Synaphobranchus kaupii TaxID=118154 RepID=A0A9Q1FTD2_SYNKA|nr:hypothetical protein SKAU_G00144700 [Synaphobranchus kaupii]
MMALRLFIQLGVVVDPMDNNLRSGEPAPPPSSVIQSNGTPRCRLVAQPDRSAQSAMNRQLLVSERPLVLQSVL